MKNSVIKVRVAKADKERLEAFANDAGKTVSDILRSAIAETMRGRVAGYERRDNIARLRRSTNQMLQVLAGKPVDVPKLKDTAAQVRKDAGRVLV
jgi:predicted DNA-binding protein